MKKNTAGLVRNPKKQNTDCWYQSGRKPIIKEILHYENMPMQNFKSCKKMKIFRRTFLIFFLVFVKTKIYTMFWSKNKKNGYTFANPSFAI